MAGHLNHKISLYGRGIAIRLLSSHGYLVTEDEARLTVAERNGRRYLVSTNTKRPDVRHKEKVTGRNQTDIDTLTSKAEANGCTDVLMVFIDAQSQIVSSAMLSELMKPARFSGLYFPLIETTHSARIVYWSIYMMGQLGAVYGGEVEHLKSLISRNAQAKNQTHLFQ